MAQTKAMFQFTQLLVKDYGSIKAAIESPGAWQSYLQEKVEGFVSENSELFSRSSGRIATQPGSCFDTELCRCRIWDSKTGLPKQCPNAKGDDTVCKMHTKKICETEEGVWKFGFYDEELPTHHLSGKEYGKSIAWKVDGYVPKNSGGRKSGSGKKEPAKFSRPKGRSPKGKVWDGENGGWIDSQESLDPLNSKKISELKKLAKELGITTVILDKIDDSKNPKQKLVHYINRNKPDESAESVVPVETPAPETPAPETPAPVEKSVEPVVLAPLPSNSAEWKEMEKNFIDQPNHMEYKVNTENETITFEGVEYMWDQSDGSLTDPDNYEEVGKWTDGKIEFKDDAMLEMHTENVNHVSNTPA